MARSSHGQRVAAADDQRSLPSVDMVYSEDSSDAASFASLLVRQRMVPPRDVRRCKSQICQACSNDGSSERRWPPETSFVPCRPVDPSEIRQLPKRWWDYEDVVHFNLMETIAGVFFCHLPDHQPNDDQPVGACVLCGDGGTAADDDEEEEERFPNAALGGVAGAQGGSSWISTGSTTTATNDRSSNPQVEETKRNTKSNSRDEDDTSISFREYRFILTPVNEEEDLAPFDEGGYQYY